MHPNGHESGHAAPDHDRWEGHLAARNILHWGGFTQDSRPSLRLVSFITAPPGISWVKQGKGRPVVEFSSPSARICARPKRSIVAAPYSSRTRKSGVSWTVSSPTWTGEAFRRLYFPRQLQRVRHPSELLRQFPDFVGVFVVTSMFAQIRFAGRAS